MDYHDDPGNVLGDDDELGLIFLVRTANRRIRGHVHQLPVSQDFTREAGQAGGTGGTGGTGAPAVQLRTSVRPALRLRGLGKPRPLQVCQFRTGVAGIIRAAG